MKPQVTLNEIPFSDDIKNSIPNEVINSLGRDAQKGFRSMKISKTDDGENPWVIIVCTPNGLMIDKNF